LAPATASRAYYSDVRAEVGSSRVEHRPVASLPSISVPPPGVEPDDSVWTLGTLLGPEGTGFEPCTSGTGRKIGASDRLDRMNRPACVG
jgi:hypothetical protein